MEKAAIDLLLRLVKEIETGCELMGSKWGNCEAEVIALQTLAACALNFQAHGELLSWQGVGTQECSGGGLVNNPKGMDSLLADDSITIEPYTGTLLPSEPKRIVKKGKQFMVLRISESLIYYAASQMKVK